MKTAATTFAEPHLTKVRSAVEAGVSMGWDGCHKIYICGDRERSDAMQRNGYEQIDIDDVDDIVATLWDWFSRSCGLRFVYAIHTDPSASHGVRFEDVIGQFQCLQDDIDFELMMTQGENQ